MKMSYEDEYNCTVIVTPVNARVCDNEEHEGAEVWARLMSEDGLAVEAFSPYDPPSNEEPCREYLEWCKREGKPVGTTWTARAWWESTS